MRIVFSSTQGSGTIYYDPVSVSPSTGGMYFDLAYAPFGETYAASGSTDPSFTGQRQDTVSGLYDFPAREYSFTGRWVSPDPAGLAAVDPTNPQSWNRYAYVMNNPMNSVDPAGLDGCNVWNVSYEGSGPGFPCPCDPSDASCSEGGGGGIGIGISGGGGGGASPVDPPFGNGPIWNEQIPIYSGSINPFFIIENFIGANGYGGWTGIPCLPPIVGVWFEGNWCAYSIIVPCASPRLAPGAAHCGIVTSSGGLNTRYDGKPSTESYQMLTPFSNQPKLVVQQIPGLGTIKGDTIIFGASVPQGTVQCIQDVSNYFNSAQWTYSAVFLNSNTFAVDATSSCGLNVHFPWNAVN